MKSIFYVRLITTRLATPRIVRYSYLHLFSTNVTLFCYLYTYFISHVIYPTLSPISSPPTSTFSCFVSLTLSRRLSPTQYMHNMRFTFRLKIMQQLISYYIVCTFSELLCPPSTPNISDFSTLSLYTSSTYLLTTSYPLPTSFYYLLFPRLSLSTSLAYLLPRIISTK